MFRIACASLGGLVRLIRPSGGAGPHHYPCVPGDGRSTKNPDTVQRLATEGAVAVGNPPEEFAAFVRTEIAEWTKLIHDMKL